MLGSMLFEHGRGSAMVGLRLESASRAFWADASALRCKELSLQARLERFSRCIIPITLHCAGSWGWSFGLYRRFRVWE
eukprot:1284553-Alexandrium_andersonii.AAC.1